MPVEKLLPVDRRIEDAEGDEYEGCERERRSEPSMIITASQE